MKFNLYYFILCGILCLACQESSKAPVVSTTPATPTAPPVTPKNATASTEDLADLPELVQEAPLTAHAQQFYCNLYWHYEAAIVIKDPEKSKAYTGKWIKFNPDNTLETGFYDGPVKKGNWIVDEEKAILTIVEGGERPTYSEWKIKTSSSSDDIMVWVGTRRFNLNNTQIKMLRYGEKPSEIAAKK